MKREKKVNVQRAILAAVAVTGLLAVAVVAPNAAGLIAKLGRAPHKRQSEVIKRAQRTLVARGYLRYEGGFVRITPKGEKELQALELKDFQIKKPRRWDGKWRVLAFDIPERRRKTRDRIRETLKRIGFMHMQDSVWLYPHDCQELVVLLKADLHIGKAVRYMVVAELEGDRVYRDYFEVS